MSFSVRENSPFLLLLGVGIAAFLGGALLLFSLYNTQEDLWSRRCD